MADPTIGIVGATGVVGRQLLNALALRDFDAGRVRLFASQRSEGEELELDGEALAVEQVDTFAGLGAVILAVPAEIARPLAQRAQEQGVWVVDVSGAHRVDEGVPLVAPGINDGVLDVPFTGRIVSLAWAPTQGFLAALEPLRQKFGLAFADAVVLLGAASLGNAGVACLSKQTAELMNGKEPDVDVFPHRLAFNVIPASGDFQQALCRAERTVLVETARIWTGLNDRASGAKRGPKAGIESQPRSAERPENATAATCTVLTVPTYHGAMLVLTAHLRARVDADGVRAALKADTGLKLLDEPDANVYPMPMLTNDDATVHVGRVRAFGERVQLVASLDNAFRAADSALDVALELADRG